MSQKKMKKMRQIKMLEKDVSTKYWNIGSQLDFVNTS